MTDLQKLPSAKSDGVVQQIQDNRAALDSLATTAPAAVEGPAQHLVNDLDNVAKTGSIDTLNLDDVQDIKRIGAYCGVSVDLGGTGTTGSTGAAGTPSAGSKGAGSATQPGGSGSTGAAGGTDDTGSTGAGSTGSTGGTGTTGSRSRGRTGSTGSGSTGTGSGSTGSTGNTGLGDSN